ncbi:MAG: hypothetical protein E7365_07310 [Clostridiales bacterium]|nr:hypothetical protein [Clostridiales bacterium]
MNYINQLNYPDLIYITRTKLEGADRESGKTTTIKSSGCGLCCAVMVAKNLIPDCNFEIEDAIKLSYESEANAYIGTNYKFFAPAFSQKFNLEYESTCDIERLKDWLGSGGIAVANVGGDREGYTGVFSKKGHYITVINLENDNRVALLDPSYCEGKYESEGRKGKVKMKDGFIAVCDISVLKKDAENRNPSFHLFRLNNK